jgi:hypothetical protein
LIEGLCAADGLVNGLLKLFFLHLKLRFQGNELSFQQGALSLQFLLYSLYFLLSRQHQCVIQRLSGQPGRTGQHA